MTGDDLCSSYLQCTKQVVILHTSNFDVLFNKFAITSTCAAIGSDFHSQNIRIGSPISGASGFRLRTTLRQERGRFSTPYHLDPVRSQLEKSTDEVPHKDKSEKNNLYQLQLHSDPTLFINVAQRGCVRIQTNEFEFEHGMRVIEQKNY